MLPIWLEILGSFVVVILGFIYIMKKVVDHKVGKKIWKLYSEVSDRTDLKTRKSLNIFSDWPDLHGEIEGKKVYVHPNKGSKRKNRPSKTIFGIESDIELESDVIVLPSSTSMSPDAYEYEFEVPNLNKHNFSVYSQSKLDEEKVDDIFTKEVTGKINDLVKKNQENFRAIILEPGLVMFSIYSLEFEKDEVLENLKRSSKIVTAIEQNLGDEFLNENFVNLRIEKLSKGSRTTLVKTAASCILLGVSIYLFYQIIQGFSFFLMNAGIFALAISLLNLYILSKIRYD
ncbi:MAG: hypothetical protein V5A88_02490 [Candidatus Thermoplasmatota archaeon]